MIYIHVWHYTLLVVYARKEEEVVVKKENGKVVVWYDSLFDSMTA